MRYKEFAAVFALSGLAAVAQAGTVVSESFDSGADGWAAVNGGTDTVFSATGGVGDSGYIYGTNKTVKTVWVFQASTSFISDLSAAYGGTLSYSLEVSEVKQGGSMFPNVQIVGNDGLTLKAYTNSGPTNANTWTSFSVALTPGAWYLSTGQLASATQMQSVLSSVSAFYIRGDYAPLTKGNKGITTGLDSVLITSAVPEPAAWAMWLGGLLAVGSLSRRRGAPKVR